MVTVTGYYGTATGSVEVDDGAGATCSITLSGGSGSCNLTSTSAGSKTITADYSGDGVYNPSSETDVHNVFKLATTTTITGDDLDPSTVGQSYSVSVAVDAAYGIPTGTVGVNDGSGASCTATLSGGSGSCDLTSSSAGSKTLTASYSGDANYNASSDIETHTVAKSASTTTITSDSPEPSFVGQSYIVAVTVAGSFGAPTGTVGISDGSATCTATLGGSGTGSCSLISTTRGGETLTANC